MTVQNWATGADMLALRKRGWYEVRRDLADDGRTVVQLQHQDTRETTQRSLRDIPIVGQLAFDGVAPAATPRVRPAPTVQDALFTAPALPAGQLPFA